MKLPNSDRAIVDRDKIVNYLLNPTHRHGRTKAGFFQRFGFRLNEWELLARALRAHGQEFEVVEERISEFGRSYRVEGGLRTPDGRNPAVRTVWQIDHGAVAPRLVTAYPVGSEP